MEIAVAEISNDWKVAIEAGGCGEYCGGFMSDIWPQEGTYLGHYRLVQKLDEGGMGAVYKAHEAALDRYVAIKVLSPQLAQDEEFVRSFLREARAVAALNHPNIIQIYFIGQHDDYIYFAMEYIEGAALDRLDKQAQKPSPKEWLELIRQAATGLQYAHNHGLIHRDIKPSNLLLNELKMVKVADFGLARAAGSAGDASLSVADSMGTPEYMSPEEAQGEKTDHRSDIYALGATLFHLLAGKPPFTGASGTEIMMHQIHTPLPSLKKLNANVPQSICAFVEKCMAKDPADRFETYDKLIKTIDDILQKRETATRVAVPSKTAAAGAPATASRRDGMGPFVWIVVLFILLAAGYGIWKISDTQKKGKTQIEAATNKPPVVPPKRGAETPVQPPVTPRQVPPPTKQPPVAEAPVGPQGWLPLDLIGAFNRDVITRKQGANADGLVYDGSWILMTAAVKKSLGLPGPGVPDDGLVAIPGAEPVGRFRMNAFRGNDCICLSAPDGKQPKSVQIALPLLQQRRYSRLAFLTASTYGSGTLTAMLQYTEGAAQPAAIRIYDATDAKSGDVALQDNSKIALEVQPVDKKMVYALCSQIIPADPSRALRGLTLSFGDGFKPAKGGDAQTAKFLAGVFAVSAFHPGKVAAIIPPSTVQTNVAVIPPPAQTNVVVAPPPEQTNAVVAPPPVQTNVAVVPPPVAVATVAANYHDLSAKLVSLVASMQFDAADAELKRLAAAGGAVQSARWSAMAADLRRLQAFKQRISDGISARATGRAIVLVFRNGQRLDAQLSYANPDVITLKKQLPGGFAENKARWTDIAPASLLTLFGTVGDPKNNDDIYDYGLTILYQALSGQARIEDARRGLAAAGERDAKLKTEADSRLKWLDEGAAPAVTADTPAAPPAARGDRNATVAAGIVRWRWQCLDISAACNADVINTESRAAADEFSSGLGDSWTTAGWLSRNNIAGDFNGVPDDGRVMLAANDPRIAFTIARPPHKSAILLDGESGHWPRSVRLELPPDLRAPYRRLAFLHASSFGDAVISVDLTYADGTTQTRRLQALDWSPAARTHDLTPDQTIALSTRCSRLTNMGRFEMVAEILSLSDERKLAAIALSFVGATTAKRLADTTPRTTAGIFAISVAPAAQ